MKKNKFMIEFINGKAIKSYSFYKDENEILLMPGTYLCVIDRWSPVNDLYIIHLREETPPCKLIVPPFNQPSSDNSNQQLTDDDMEIVSYFLLRNNNTLVILDLESNQIGDQGAQYLGEALKKNTKRTLLDLKHNQIGDLGAQYLDIYYTLLYSNQIGDIGIEYLNEKITALNLSDNGIGDKGAKFLSEALQKNTTLMELYPEKNEIGYKGAQNLGE
ncbi:unnamed protein product [Rotaria magnacalcarata]|uniref:Uncharacterized protein n=1 Tax=Rotaria magnacalcarata TaxID=392030 RepID=A0A820DNI9_9BILA|nr:unnamed protein product [Rotaria magnacalcarata]CAF4234297.1 unnamed protein product [Rotaria magnacalcarata]